MATNEHHTQQIKFEVRYDFAGHKVGDVIDIEDVPAEFASHNFGVRIIVDKVVNHSAAKNVAGQQLPAHKAHLSKHDEE